MQEESVFTKIIRGDIPSHKIYEDDKTIAILDIHPKLPGHVLAIPKVQVEFVWDLPLEDYQALMETVRKVSLHIRQVTGQPFVHTAVIGVDIPHAHVHIMPFTDVEDLHRLQDMEAEPDYEALAALAAQMTLS